MDKSFLFTDLSPAVIRDNLQINKDLWKWWSHYSCVPSLRLKKATGRHVDDMIRHRLLDPCMALWNSKRKILPRYCSGWDVFCIEMADITILKALSAKLLKHILIYFGQKTP